MNLRLKQFASELWYGSNNASTSKSNSRYLRIFDDVIGHDDIKEIMAMALESKEPTNVLLVGDYGCAKTMIEREILKAFPDESFFCVGSQSTKAGMTDVLFDKRPKYLIIDEIETMPEKDQVILYGLMQDGTVTETKRSNTRQTKLKTWVFATCNHIDKIEGPLLDRFIIIQVKPYTRQQFDDIALELLTREHTNLDVATEIIRIVHEKRQKPSIRECLAIGKLVKNKKDKIEMVVRNLK